MIVPCSGRVYDWKDRFNALSASWDFWLTEGKYTKLFEDKFNSYLGTKSLFVNSGSSANLLAFMALTQPEWGDRRINRGDEVITTACGFPTTIAPIIQYGAVPVFVDVKIPSYNVDVNQLELALSPKTKAVILAHTLGNPFDVKLVKEFCDKHNLWLIEDNCDALGSEVEGIKTGTFGDISTHSFYPAHHITTGEGGMVCTKNPVTYKILRSLRDWGRDCTCPTGMDNCCGERFNKQIGGLPVGYDHKYTYSRAGYNLKATDIQAAIGCSQMDKLEGFISKRRENWKKLYSELNKHPWSNNYIMPKPSFNPSWFGFALTTEMDIRSAVIKHAQKHGVQTRLMFGGNLTKQPMMNGVEYRVVGELPNTEIVMKQTFWVGVYPGINDKMIDYMARVLSMEGV